MRKVCECNCPALPPNKGGYFRQVKSMFYGPSSSSSCYFYHRFSPQSTFELQALDSGIYVARTAHTSIFRKPIKIAPARGGSPNFEIHFFFLCISINLNQLSFFSDFFFFFCEMQLAIVPARLSELSGCCLLRFCPEHLFKTIQLRSYGERRAFLFLSLWRSPSQGFVTGN